MRGLTKLFYVKNGGYISAEETALIDSELSAVKSCDIPDEQVQNVCNYITSQLLYNKESIPIEEKNALEKLFHDLEVRC